MKVKMKLDVGSIKKWLLEHGEKAALGIVAVVFLLFTVSAARREVLDAKYQPEQLKSIADGASAHVQEAKWDGKKDNLVLVEYAERAVREPVAPDAYALAYPFDPPLADPKVKRDDPTLYNVEEIRVASGYNIFALHGGGGAGAAGGKGADGKAGNKKGAQQNEKGIKPAADSALEPRAWVAITALVPVQKQLEEYHRVFDHAMGGSKGHDVPRYGVPKIERAEVTDKEPAEGDWKPIENPLTFEKRWDIVANEIVAEEYFDRNLTAPLGPLVDGLWDEAVAHPKVQLGASATAPPKGAPAANAAPAGDDAPPAAAPAAAPAADADDGFTRGGAAAAAPAPAAAAATTDASAAAPIAYRLMRVFDYNAEPGKRYRYRVKLGLLNPNFGERERHLKNPESAKNKVRWTEAWGAPSEVVTVPNVGGVFAGARQKGPDPMAKIVVTTVKDGMKVGKEMTVQRGSVANTRASVAKARDPRSDAWTDVSNVVFKTDIVVLDIYGGKAVARKDKQTTSPVELLLFDSKGNLTVHSDIDDHVTYHGLLEPEDAKE